MRGRKWPFGEPLPEGFLRLSLVKKCSHIPAVQPRQHIEKRDTSFGGRRDKGIQFYLAPKIPQPNQQRHRSPILRKDVPALKASILLTAQQHGGAAPSLKFFPFLFLVVGGGAKTGEGEKEGERHYIAEIHQEVNLVETTAATSSNQVRASLLSQGYGSHWPNKE
jgi:hypothetical protein